jgi:DNA-binding NtrC family response regulator
VISRREATQSRAARAELGPPDHLLELHQHSLANLVVFGGTERQRLAVARAFHRSSPLRQGPFLHLDCSRDELALRRALQQWLVPSGAQPGINPLAAVAGGTLYLDLIGRLPVTDQRWLLMLAGQLQSDSSYPLAGPGPSRLAVGNPSDLARVVEQGGFSRDLLDCLDKIRVELPLSSKCRVA